MFNFLGKILDSNEKEIKKILPIVEEIRSKEEKTSALNDNELTGKTEEFKNRLGGGEPLDNILGEAFAVVREAAKRTIGERHFDAQMVAATALHQGRIAEQKTGEGKTLTATLPLYLNALTEKGCHLVTVNDYLSKIGCGWMGPVYNLLGVSVSAIIHDESFIFDPNFENTSAQDWRLKHLRPISRKEAYLADITYGINSEFGFDYLRDNMATNLKEVVQRNFHYAIVDEVDSVLIDEARTPHIISAPDTEPTQKYFEYAVLVEKLTPKLDFVIDEKLRTAHLTEHGLAKVEKLLGITNIYEKDFQIVHHVEAALKAKALFIKDKDYVVRDGQIVIVDEFTGRLMPGRRWSEGIHQAIEAKENVVIQQESRTLATISLQNYFRMYEKLAGMTGTAATEAEEFHKIYKLDVLIIPTNKPMVRKDFPDSVFKTARAKYAAVVKDIEDCYKRGQPVLVGTTSIEKNEIISQFLRHKGIPHQVLNAKQHEREASIISEAGQKGSVTVATNMAGRGVDIILGGVAPKFPDGKPDRETDLWKKWQKDHEEIVSLGGLHVIGTERHESRRIDNQLRGRGGRQGDPGTSRFYVGLDDDIMRLFGGDQVSRLMTMFNIPEDVPLEHPMVSKAIEQAQTKVEGFNFDARKHLVEYDDVMNKQREIVYKKRKKILEMGESEKEEDKEILKNEAMDVLTNDVENFVNLYSPEGEIEPDKGKILQEFISIVPFDENSQKQIQEQMIGLHGNVETKDFLIKILTDVYTQREKALGKDLMRQVERWIMLSVIDNLWMDHLDAVDDLREGIGLRGYGQRDPLVEYKSEAFSMFEKLMAAIDSEIARRIFKVQVAAQPTVPQRIYATPAGGSSETPSSPNPVIHGAKIGRNDSCWCKSGKKWKRCHYPDPGPTQ